MLKTCRNCKLEKPITDFHKHSSYKDGHRSQCAECCTQKAREKYKISPEEEKQRTKQYRLEHLEKYKARAVEYNKVYWQENRPLANHHHQLRRARKLQASTGTVTKEFVTNLYETTVCHWCKSYTEPELRTMDHIVPLAKGGLHDISNLVMACRACNFSKNDSLVADWLPTIVNKPLDEADCGGTSILPHNLPDELLGGRG